MTWKRVASYIGRWRGPRAGGCCRDQKAEKRPAVHDLGEEPPGRRAVGATARASENGAVGSRDRVGELGRETVSQEEGPRHRAQTPSLGFILTTVKTTGRL